MPHFELEKQDRARDAAFKQALHGKTAASDNSFMNMMQKDKTAQKAAVDEYFKHWDNKPAGTETEATREERRKEYATLTRHYYNLATDLYEYGWGQSFHFCTFTKGEPFRQAIARHEHYLALKMGLKEGDRVADFGAGVGGPAREIAKFSGCHITGVNNNDYQIERATRYAHQEKLDKQLTFVKADFLQSGFADETFDAVYAIEATCHSPSLELVYKEIARILKPNGVAGIYEWAMCDNFDENNPRHREIRLGIEQGDGIAALQTKATALAAMKAAGFEIEYVEDLAERPTDYPWYWPLSGDLRYMQTIFDFPTLIRMTKIGRGIVHRFVGALEMIGLAPKGTQKTADSLAVAADCLVEGGSKRLFTPAYLMVGRKPAN